MTAQKQKQVTAAEWAHLVQKAKTCIRTIDDFRFELGKLALEVERTYGSNSFKKFADEIGIRPPTLYRYALVQKTFGDFISTNKIKLPYYFLHLCLSSKNPLEQALTAQKEDWSIGQLSARLDRKKGKVQSLLFNSHKFSETNYMVGYLVNFIKGQWVCGCQAGALGKPCKHVKYLLEVVENV